MRREDTTLLERDKLHILVDSKSLDTICVESPKRAERILEYQSEALFEFVRTPQETNCKYLNDIRQLDYVLEEGKLHALRTSTNDDEGQTSEERVWFPYDERDVYLVGTHVFSNATLSDAEKEAIMLVHLNMAWDWKNEGVMLTENKQVLAARVRISARPTMKRTIMNIDELSELMDLFAKRNGKYFLAPHHTANKGLWYWISLRSKLPHYNVSMDDSSLLNALASRFRYLSMGIDEMGTQYHLGTNNDTQEDMIYHFNYFITLMTGIFDNLALESRSRYKITFDHDFIASRTSLSNNSGGDFLRELKKQNPDLREHIQRHADFISLIYELREVAVHREGFRKMGLEYDNITEKWEANVIQISPNAGQIIQRIGDSQIQYSPFSKWGIYRIYKDLHLEPYRFSKTASIVLIRFVDKFLELLGEKNWVTSNSNEVTKDIQILEGRSLGFYADKEDR